MRWLRVLDHSVPLVDRNDLFRGHRRTQFAPEFSQQAFETMLRQETALGDFYNATLRESMDH